MSIAVGIDIAKEVYWATAIDAAGEILLDQRVANQPAALDELVSRLRSLGGEVTIGLDVVGGIATLTAVMLSQAGFRLVHVSGLAVNRARQGFAGGESKSDPRDARVIAEQVRTRRDLRPVTAGSELETEIRLLVSRRRDLVVDQTRRLALLHDLLAGVHPGLEHVLDLTTKGALWLLTRYVTPAELRAGRAPAPGRLPQAGRCSPRRGSSRGRGPCPR
jgi:transposase